MCMRAGFRIRTCPGSELQTAADQLADAVRAAAADGRVLHIRGGDSKRGLGGVPRGEHLSTLALRGIVDYDPAELVVTVGAGTPLGDLQAELAAQRQMLPFEPPAWPGATVGGVLASGLAGPRRAFSGGVRDALLGVRLLDGRAQRLQFGGRVMKNVAGFDLFRLQAGAWGRLGIILESSLRLLPRPQREHTMVLSMDADTALERMNRVAGTPLPLSAAAWIEGTLYLRLSGSEAGVRSALPVLGGEALADHRATLFWAACAGMPPPTSVAGNEGSTDLPLWRLVLPSTTRSLASEGEFAIDWCGGLRWLRTDAQPGAVRALATSLGGHATAWRGNPARPAMHPVDPVREALHRNLFSVFDPYGVFGSGRFDAAE